MTEFQRRGDQPEGDEERQFDPSAYPRRYRLRPFWWGLQFLLSLALMAVPALLLVREQLGIGVPADMPPVLSAVILVGVALLGLLGVRSLLWLAMHGVVLHVDAIERRGVFHTRRVELTDIDGWRWMPNGLRSVRLQMKPGCGGDLVVSGALALDEAAAAWLDRLPNLDARAHAAALLSLQQDGSWGRTAEQRLANIDIARKATTGVVLVLSTLTLASLGWLRHEAWPVFCVAAVPLLALAGAALSAGRLRLDASPHDPRPRLTGLIVVAVLVLAARLGTEIELESVSRLALAALVPGAVLAACAWRVSGIKSLGGRRWPFLPVAWVYGGALLLLINVYGDHAPSTQGEQAVVTFKRWAGQRLRSFSLDVDRLSTKGAPRTISVALNTFNNVSPGEIVCINHRAGRLGFAWTDVRPCEKLTGQPLQASDPLHRALVLGAFRPERRGPLLKLLIERKFDELDGHLAQLQARYERGDVDSSELLRTYRNFYDPNPELGVLYDAWIERFPSSYPAYLARGIYRKFQSETIGAAGFERWVSPTHNVERYLDMQVSDLEHSTTLAKKPLLSYVHLMDAARHRGQADHLRALLDRGLAVDPGSLPLARKYLVTVMGGREAMTRFVAECVERGMPANTLNTLRARMLVDEAYFKQRERNDDAALELLHRAEALEPYVEELAMVKHEAALIYIRRKQFDVAMALLQGALLANPENANAHASMAYALWQVGRREESLIARHEAAELGSAASQAFLGEEYLKGALLLRDETKAAYWLNRAAARGNKAAHQLLKDNPPLREDRFNP
jgi:tetratricopeptide (TPR) repeat protein